MLNPDDRCPCLSGETFGACCGSIHAGSRKALTAEQLMRSRFSAFAVGDSGYLLASWHPDTRPSEIDLDPSIRWLRLDIVNTDHGRMLDQIGTVEFCAHYRTIPTVDEALLGQKPERGELHEVSRFARVDGLWVYLDGFLD